MSMTAATAFRDFPWKPKDTLHRLAGAGRSYDSASHTCRAVLSTGAAVQRPYGLEEIDLKGVDLRRARAGLVPFIDSHQVQGIASALGRTSDFGFVQGNLECLVTFDDSDAGRNAEGLFARGTVNSFSMGYAVQKWEVTDPDGNVVDPERERLAWDEEYTFTAKRWELLEVSAVLIPADPGATIRSRSFGASASIGEEGAAEVLKRMRALQRAALTPSESVTLHRRRVYPGGGRFWRGS
jgi:hypothetical protein